MLFDNLLECSKNKFWIFLLFPLGILVVEDSNRSEWLYLIKSGTCKIIKCLKPRELEDDPVRIRKLMAKKKREELLQRIESNNMRPQSSTGLLLFLSLSCRFFQWEPSFFYHLIKEHFSIASQVTWVIKTKQSQCIKQVSYNVKLDDILTNDFF